MRCPICGKRMKAQQRAGGCYYAWQCNNSHTLEQLKKYEKGGNPITATHKESFAKRVWRKMVEGSWFCFSRKRST